MRDWRAALKSRTREFQHTAALAEKQCRDEFRTVLSVARAAEASAKLDVTDARAVERTANRVFNATHTIAVEAMEALGDSRLFDATRTNAVAAVRDLAVARNAATLALGVFFSARESEDTAARAVSHMRRTEQQRRASNARVPLDWLPDQPRLGLPWSRAGHAHDPFCNATLTAFLLGLEVLSAPDRLELPAVDPEIIEEAFTVSIRLFGATRYIDTKRHTFFGNASSDHLFSGAVSIREPTWTASGFAFNGVIYGTKALRTAPSGRTISSYVGYMHESMRDSKPSMHPSGDGAMTYEDGSVYTGQFRGGVRFGHGTLCDAAGVLYTGQWDVNPAGEGCIRVAPGVYHKGSFVDGLSTSVDLDLVSDGPAPCPAAIAPVGVLSDGLAARLSLAGKVSNEGILLLRMTGADLVGVAHLLLTACHTA